MSTTTPTSTAILITHCLHNHHLPCHRHCHRQFRTRTSVAHRALCSCATPSLPPCLHFFDRSIHRPSSHFTTLLCVACLPLLASCSFVRHDRLDPLPPLLRHPLLPSLRARCKEVHQRRRLVASSVLLPQRGQVVAATVTVTAAARQR